MWKRVLFAFVGLVIVCAKCAAQLPVDEAYRRLQEREQARKAASTQLSGGAATSQPTSKPSVAPASPSYFEHILSELPDDARPNAKDGWDEFVAPKARKWLDANCPGTKVDVLAEIKQLGIVRVARAEDPNETLRWEIALTPAPHQFFYRGFGHSGFFVGGVEEPVIRGEEIVNPGGPQPVHIVVDEATARRAKGLREGDLIRFKGRVTRVFVTDAPFVRADAALFGALDEWSHHKPGERRGFVTVAVSDCTFVEALPKPRARQTNSSPTAPRRTEQAVPDAPGVRQRRK